ncbi:hypothetical protein AVEN_42517-1 [Araneus ventricosus]|uniref:F-box domain-containing protein n=1 Tax=Araneus ventricosus TaxID=182803 RepID=A0A4Y2PM11_ARAVE|nr:hypothetical protein AVEN_42517-1 [Araneus ventricosus]
MAERIQSDEREEYDEQVQWRDLPTSALKMVYSFASRDDQLNMSVVCRNWSEGFRSASVSKTFRFDITESQLSIRTCPRLKFVEKYGDMFRHVEIDCNFDEKKLGFIQTWCRNFIEFLKILASKSKLKSVNFRDLSYCFVQIDNPTQKEIWSAIANFLESQHHLKRVEFHNCCFRFSEGVKLLSKLIESNSESLTHLVLREFIRWKSMRENEHSKPVINLTDLLGLPHFTTLETEFLPSFVFMFACQPSAIQTLKKCQTRLPRKIILNDHDNIEIGKVGRLTSDDWMFLKNIYPDLQVEFNFSTDSPSLRKVNLFIASNMPITRLNCRFEYKFAVHLMPFMEVYELFHHLLACKTNDHLVSLHFGWSRIIPDLASVFIPFLLACKKLKCLELFIVCPSNGVDLLLESWLQNRPESLEKVHIVISGFKDDYDIMNLTTEYVNRLRLVGLNLDVDFKFDR